MKWLLLVVAVVAIFFAYQSNKQRRRQGAVVGTILALVCMIGFFLVHFGVFESFAHGDPSAVSNSALGIGLVDIMRSNGINNMSEIPFFIQQEDDISKAMIQTMIDSGFADAVVYSAEDREYDSVEDLMYDVPINNYPAVIVRGDVSADALSDYNGKIIIIGKKPAGVRNVIATITVKGVEEAKSADPKAAFKEIYEVVE